ncbi:MAG TPA: histidinol-phosphate transaminase [Candidatus Limnocylindrales bacterium]|nr:histidinol-phosphate transaminase [Candidatus Limnocylindrales bacterium]
MQRPLFSRRDFSRVIGQSLAVAVSAPYLRAAQAGARHEQPVPEGAIHLNFNESPYGPSPKALQALATCGHTAARYPDMLYFQMLDSLAQIHGVKRENITLGCGSTEILCIADEAFLGPGKNLVVAEPTFEAVVEYVNASHGDVIKVPLTSDYRHDLNKMAAACTSKTGLVYVCNPNNPTGTIVSRDELSAFVDRVPSSAVILVDEAYFHFADDPSYGTAIDFIASHPNVVVARTFSKVYGMAGMRLGYAVGSKENIEAMRPYNLQPFNGNCAVLAAAHGSLSDQDYIKDCARKMNATRQWLCDQVAKDGHKFIPSQANFVMVEAGGDVGPLVDKFRERKILVGRRFPSLPNYLRISMGTQAEVEQFAAAFREIVPASTSRAA